jgi:hypothetical protein
MPQRTPAAEAPNETSGATLPSFDLPTGKKKLLTSYHENDLFTYRNRLLPVQFLEPFVVQETGAKFA